MKLIPTILCGGAGSRMWPVSREHHPKPFIRLADGQSLLQKAFLRGAQLNGVSEVLTITNRELLFKTEDEFREVNAKNLDTFFILEPFGRNTAPAIVAAALQMAQRHGEDAILLVLAADHLISDQIAFEQAVIKATDLAVTGKLVTFGIQPEGPETGYGYIEADGNTVIRFVEKPSLEKAQEYFASGKFLWNSGIFCFTAGSLIREMEKYTPQILADVRDCLARSRVSEGVGFVRVELDSKTFARVHEDSIDYAVMEKSDQVAVVPCSIGWVDIGSWSALADLDEADDNGNRVKGEVVLHATYNCTIQNTNQGNNRLVATVGVKDLIIIDTADAVLIADKTRAQDVKHIYAKLKLIGHHAHKLHRTEFRPWGSYTVLMEWPGCKVKSIIVNPKQRLSLQLHKHRSEHWFVVNGKASVTRNGQTFELREAESTYIEAGCKHRLANKTSHPLIILEMQYGSNISEDDIERFDDDYVRIFK